MKALIAAKRWTNQWVKSCKKWMLTKTLFSLCIIYKELNYLYLEQSNKIS
jgi:hypothetical protein